MQPGLGGEQAPARTFIETARRAQIISATVQTIAAEGYAQASFVRIAARAVISPGLITYHFKTKDELIRAVLAHLDANLDTAMSDGPEPTSYAEALERILTGYVRHCAQHPDEMTALHQIITNASSPRLRRLVTERGKAGSAELVEFLAEGQRHGEFRNFDPEIFAATMLAAMQAVPQWLRDHAEAEPEHYARELADLFVRSAQQEATRR